MLRMQTWATQWESSGMKTHWIHCSPHFICKWVRFGYMFCQTAKEGRKKNKKKNWLVINLNPVVGVGAGCTGWVARNCTAQSKSAVMALLPQCDRWRQQWTFHLQPRPRAPARQRRSTSGEMNYRAVIYHDRPIGKNTNEQLANLAFN